MSIAEILAPFREEIIQGWARRLYTDVRARCSAPPIEELFSTVSEAAEANFAVLVRNDFSKIDAFIEKIAQMRSRSDFPLTDVVKAFELSIHRHADRRRAEEALKKSETLLLAEDNADIRTVTSDMLRMSGYTLIEAVNGREAVERFREHQGRYN
jgi:PleD family two-component response regulator